MPGEAKNHVDIVLTFTEFSNTSKILIFTTDICKDILKKVKPISEDVGTIYMNRIGSSLTYDRRNKFFMIRIVIMAVKT